MKYCTLGGCSFSYLYILFTVLLFFLRSSILSLGELSINTRINIFGIEPILLKHDLMKLLLKYIGYDLYGALFLCIFSKKKIFKKKEEEFPEQINKLIYINRNKLSSRALKLILIACSLFSIQLIIRNIMNFLGLYMLDLWIFNIVFISLFMKKILKIFIYKHQLYSLVFIFGINLILLIVASSIKDNKSGKSDYESIKNNFGNYFYIVLFYLVFLILAAILSLSQVLQKHLMDFEYVSPFKILLAISIFSTFFSFIALMITTNVRCNEKLIEINVCPSVTKDKISFYFDSFTIFRDNLKEQYNKDRKAFFIEILLVYLLYSLASYFKYFFETLVIYHLSPDYVLISDNMYYSVRKIISLIGNPKDIKTYLKLFGEIIALFGYIIYLEIIQFSCWGMNYNTRISISERSRSDSLVLDIEDYEDEEDDDEKDINNKKDILIKQENEMIEIEGTDRDNEDNNDNYV